MFREEAIELAKLIILYWESDRNFLEIVNLLENYITDIDSKYRKDV